MRDRRCRQSLFRLDGAIFRNFPREVVVHGMSKCGDEYGGSCHSPRKEIRSLDAVCVGVFGGHTDHQPYCGMRARVCLWG